MMNNNYKPSKQDKMLAHFYKNVATLIKKSPNGRVALTTLEERMPRHNLPSFRGYNGVMQRNGSRPLMAKHPVCGMR